MSWQRQRRRLREEDIEYLIGRTAGRTAGVTTALHLSQGRPEFRFWPIAPVRSTRPHAIGKGTNAESAAFDADDPKQA